MIKNIVFYIMDLLTGCLSTSKESSTLKSNMDSSTDDTVSSSPNLVHNLLVYKEISLQDELQRYDNISSIRIEDLNTPNAVFISGDSVYKNQLIKFNASSNTVKVQLNLSNGSTISVIKR